MDDRLNVFWANEWFWGWLALLLAAVLCFLLLAYRRERQRHIKNHQQLMQAHKHAVRQLQSSVTDTRAMLDQASLIVMVFDRSTITLRFANRQALELFECDTVSELSDRMLMRPDAWQPHPFTLIDFEEWVTRARVSGTERREWLFTGGSGQGVWVDGSIGNTVFEGQAAQILTATNIHDYKVTQAADQLRARSLIGINASQPIEHVLEGLCKLASIRFPGVSSQFALYDEQRGVLVNVGTSAFATAMKDLLPSLRAGYAATSIGTAAHTGARVICESVKTDHRWQGYTHVAEKLDISASWSEPVVGQDGKLLGVFSIFSELPQRPDKEHLETIASIVSMAGLAIERKTWRESLESAVSSEKFIRQLGVDIVNLPASSEFVPGLNLLLEQVLHQYELGVVSLWEEAIDSDALKLIAHAGQTRLQAAGAENAQSEGLATVDHELVLDTVGDQIYKYLMPDETGYSPLRFGDEPKPILIFPLHADAKKNRVAGLLVVQSQFFYVPQDVIDHLVVIGSILRTALLSRRLMLTLSNNVESEKNERQKLESELSVARSIQMSMVPGGGTFSERYRHWTIEAWLQPAKAVGGDLYEFIRLPSGRLILAVGDVSDKGAPAALFMARTVSLLNYLTRSLDGDLSVIAGALNDELCRANDACMFVTLLLACLDLGTGEIQWLNAGHNPPMQVGAVPDARLWSGNSGPPLGLYENVTFATDRAKIQPGENLVIYSDGVTEAFNASGQEFGDERLLMVGNRVQVCSTNLIGLLCDELTRFTGPTKQSDDITIMTIQHHGGVI